MTDIRASLYRYHIISVILGVAFYYGYVYGHSASGYLVGPLFHYIEPGQVGTFGSISINFTVGFLGAILPSVIFIILLHYLLSPTAMLFLIGASFSYFALSSLNIIDTYQSLNLGSNTYIDPDYKYNLFVKAIAGFVVLWAASWLYLKLKINTKDQ